MKVAASFLFVSASLIGCASQEGDAGGKGGGKADGGDAEIIPLTVGDCAGEATDGYEMSDANIVGDMLLVDVTYGGGCEKHTWKACWAGSFLESFPVQAKIKLFHDSNGDACESIRSEALTFDLTPMSASYKQGYQSYDGKISVGLDTFGGLYEFESLDASDVASAFSIVSSGAQYFSESESEPAWLSTTYAGKLDGATVKAKFGAAMQLPADYVFEEEPGNASPAMASWSEYDPADDDYIIDSAKAWGRVKSLMESNVLDLKYFRFGPADTDGTMAVDAGEYYLVIVGKTQDGKTVGFYVTSVET
jgi:hypothetical protein